MRRTSIPSEQLNAWARLNGIECEGVQVKTSRVSNEETPKGAGLFATRNFGANEDPAVLVAVPRDLILSREQISRYAVVDRLLKTVLDAAGAFGQITNASPDLQAEMSAPNPHTNYVQLLPRQVMLPTFYTEEEKGLLVGTSLQMALDQKMRSLEKEFDELQQHTQDIPWCQSCWWGEAGGKLAFEDWLIVDALYRSRALDLPGSGHAMVPYVDMANHASDNETITLYDTDKDGQAVLHLLPGKALAKGEEVTITYGDEKGASEMIFSYGFLESSMSSAKAIFLDLDLPDDDPLKLAKKAVNVAAPGVKLFVDQDGQLHWQSDYIWWSVINEEDGLDFRLAQENDGSRRLEVRWKEEVIDSCILSKLLLEDPRLEIFRLRAIVLLQERVETQVANLGAQGEFFANSQGHPAVRDEVWQLISRLRNLERDLLINFGRFFDAKKTELLKSERVKAYLEAAQATSDSGDPVYNEMDDFS